MLLNNQPNLTRTIKNLESELGCPLFSRTNRGMKLTPEGEKLYSHIKIALKHIEAGEDEITDVKNLQRLPLNACFCRLLKNSGSSIRELK